MRRLIPVFCLMAGPLAAETPRVIADIAPVHSLVAQVMAGVGEPDLLVPADASPHDYAMRPSEARALSNADLVVTIGSALTPWLDETLDTLAEGTERLVLMDARGIMTMEFREGVRFEAHDHGHDEAHGHEDHTDHDAHDHGKDEEHADHDGHDHGKDEEHAAHDHDKHDDHAHKDEDHAEHAHDEHAHDEDHAHEAKEAGHDDDHGHDHAGGLDPHIWLDPANGAAALSAIAEALSEMDPDNAATYARNAEAAQGELTQLQAELSEKLTPVAGKPFIVMHDAYHYFEARFGVEALAAVSAGDAATPGAARITELRATVDDATVFCAFAEPQMNVSLLKTVMEGQDARLAVLDPLGSSLEPGPDLYPTLLREMGDAIATCLTS